MRYIDGEMTEPERKAFELHCADCSSCREQLAKFAQLEELTRRVKMIDPMDEFWEKYWRSLYRRVERKTAWVLLFSGFAILIFYVLRDFVSSIKFITMDKIAVMLIAAGFILLLLSLARERYYQSKSDPYRNVKR